MKKTNEVFTKLSDGTMELVETNLVTVDDEKVENYRKAAYQKEADHLFFLVQRGELDQQVWLDKIAEIRNRYPYSHEDEG